MQRMNYDKLRDGIIAAWRTARNEDNDPITAGQIRGAEVSGAFAAFLAAELDREDGNLLMPVQIAAAIVANQINNLAVGSFNLNGQNGYDTICEAFLLATAKYLDGMRAINEGADKAPGVAKMSTKVPVEREEVPN